LNKFFVVFLFLVFGGWSILGTGWYMCHVKDECKDRSLEEALAILNVEDESHDNEGLTFTEETELLTEVQDFEKDIEELDQPKVLDNLEKVLKPRKALDKFEVLEGKILFGSEQRSPTESLEVTNHLKSVVKDFLANEKKYENLIVSGHTDNVGKPYVNTELGFRRANTIKALLMRFGLSEKKIKVKSIGQFRPLGSNKTPEGRKLNRRVEITFK